MRAFTLFHVGISLVAIVFGMAVVVRMIVNRPCGISTPVFLVTTLLTSVTGFLFPIHGFTPGLGVGGLSIVVLAVAGHALYRRRLAGAWRPAYVVSAVLAEFFNCFVLVAQSFQKIPALHALAPTQSEPPFAAAQGALLVLFIALGWFAVRGFRPAPEPAAAG